MRYFKRLNTKTYAVYGINAAMKCTAFNSMDLPFTGALYSSSNMLCVDLDVMLVVLPDLCALGQTEK